MFNFAVVALKLLCIPYFFVAYYNVSAVKRFKKTTICYDSLYFPLFFKDESFKVYF